MCVILYKPKNVLLPQKDILYKCYTYNNDGAGYTFTAEKNVIIKKGYKDFNEFYTSLLKDYKKYHLTKHNLIIHFRIGTSGGITKEKTQPFKISNNIKELNKLYIKNKKASIVHNGVFNNYTYNANNSDTQNYIKDFLHPLLHSKILNKRDVIYNSIKSSKIAILTKSDKVFLYGEYIKYNGVYYSNNSFNGYINIKDSIKYDFKGDIDTNGDVKEDSIIQYYNDDYFSKYKDYKIWEYNYNYDY